MISKRLFLQLPALLALPQAETVAAASLADPAASFLTKMSREHGFDLSELRTLFADLQSNNEVLRLITPPQKIGLPPVFWREYRARHITGRIISAGLAFIRTNNSLLARAEGEIGVAREIITAIIGIETRYGRNTGSFSVLEALGTLAFGYPPRGDFFQSELEQYLLLAREQGFDPAILEGSYAGAFGLPQFLPSSARRFAIDFDNDRKLDLFAPADAIGSVANFLHEHGWLREQPVAFPTIPTAQTRPDDLLQHGIIPKLSLADFKRAGFSISFPARSEHQGPFALVDLVNEKQTEYRAGTHNYYALTRYNRSNKYAMTVLDLATEIGLRLPESS